jgi:hypothetical protein
MGKREGTGGEIKRSLCAHFVLQSYHGLRRKEIPPTTERMSALTQVAAMSQLRDIELTLDGEEPTAQNL